MPYVNTQSTVTLQTIVNDTMTFPDLLPVLNVAGQTVRSRTIATDVMNAICSVAFPWKWNEIIIPPFYTNSYQQDYAGITPSGASITNLSWLERGIVVDINNDAQPKPFQAVETGRQLPQATGAFYNTATYDTLFTVNYFPNNTLYYGTWGDAQTGNGSLGNNPVSGSVYTALLGAQSMPNNPIMQIQDANGNLLVLTGFGHEGSTAPVAPANSAAGVIATPGAGATTVWTVVDPYGMGFRILPVPSQTGVVWQFNLVGQALPIRFKTMQQTLFPLPDQYEPNFRQMFVAQCYRYSPEKAIKAKFETEWALAMKALENCRVKSDRETEENMFTPDRGIMGGSGSQRNNQWRGGAWPFNQPSR